MNNHSSTNQRTNYHGGSPKRSSDRGKSFGHMSQNHSSYNGLHSKPSMMKILDPEISWINRRFEGSDPFEFFMTQNQAYLAICSLGGGQRIINDNYVFTSDITADDAPLIPNNYIYLNEDQQYLAKVQWQKSMTVFRKQESDMEARRNLHDILLTKIFNILEKYFHTNILQSFPVFIANRDYYSLWWSMHQKFMSRSEERAIELEKLISLNVFRPSPNCNISQFINHQKMMVLVLLKLKGQKEMFSDHQLLTWLRNSIKNGPCRDFNFQLEIARTNQWSYDTFVEQLEQKNSDMTIANSTQQIIS